MMRTNRGSRSRGKTVRGAVGALTLTLALIVPTTGASPSTLTLDTRIDAAALNPAVTLDPQLVREAAAGPTLAVFGYDKRETSRDQLEADLEASGLSVHMYEYLSVGVACLSGAAQLGPLTQAPGIRSAYADAVLTPALDQSVETAFNDDPDVWREVEGVTGEDVAIAVIDTGLDGTHPDLRMGTRVKRNAIALSSHGESLGTGGDDCIPNLYYPPEGFEHPTEGGEYDDLEDTETTSGHGTHLASVAAGDGTASGGRYTGMAPDADLFGMQVAGDASPDVEANGARPSLVRVVAGVNYVTARGVENGEFVVKVALLGLTADGLYEPFHPLAMAMRDLDGFGIVPVVPVGNAGPAESDCSEAETCNFSMLGAGDTTVSVGATPKTSRTRLEDYSSRGEAIQYSLYGYDWAYTPTVVAPGSATAARRVGLAGVTPIDDGGSELGAHGSIKNRFDAGYQPLTGTSVAAAHVAGAIALMQSAALEMKGCYLTTKQVRQILEETASPMPGYGVEEVGAGAIDTAQAIWAARFAPKVTSNLPWVCPPA